MIYIIDANNLAGKLGILDDEDFDKKLILIIKKYFVKKCNAIHLVFDSNDPMGDKYNDKNITVVYTPKDSYYKSADDKIIELTERFCEEWNEDITLITDDLGIEEKIVEIEKNLGKKIIIQRANKFADRLKRLSVEKELSDDEKGNDLNSSEMKKINRELLNIWK